MPKLRPKVCIVYKSFESSDLRLYKAELEFKFSFLRLYN